VESHSHPLKPWSMNPTKGIESRYFSAKITYYTRNIGTQQRELKERRLESSWVSRLKLNPTKGIESYTFLSFLRVPQYTWTQQRELKAVVVLQVLGAALLMNPTKGIERSLATRGRCISDCHEPNKGNWKWVAALTSVAFNWKWTQQRELKGRIVGPA